MNSKERVSAAMHFKKPDRVPVQYKYSIVGYYEHGDKLNDLYATLEGDFAPFVRIPAPQLPESDFDEQGKYHAFHRDEWGTLWEFRIFGISGIPVEFPLADIEKLETYTPPSAPQAPADIMGARKNANASRIDPYYHLHDCGSLFERLIALRPEADVLCDLMSDEPYMHRIADMIMYNNSKQVAAAIAGGADGIYFQDDYGIERSLIMSPELWRSFFLPRLKALFEPAIAAGLDVHFHSCGNVWDLLPSFAEIGVTSVWLQLPAYDMEKLAERCRELRLALAIHTDRARTMTYGTPAEVRELVLRENELFKLYDGGGWFYIEADNGFPFANIEALVNTIKEIR
jgi:uroporphyrinogen decarboxylase